jgi:hypothetical protein
MNIYIGCDPGTNGGIAVVTKKNAYAFKMPQTSKDLFDAINEISITAKNENVSVIAYLESISSSPQMGVVSSFTFGRGYGNLEMAFTAAGIPFERVRPQVWQKTMQCMSKGDKNVTKRRAQELFPDIKITHAIADALLIATYGLKQ